MADTSGVVTAAQAIIDSGKYKYGKSRKEGYLTDDIMDCSEFVYHSYRNAGFLSFPAINSHTMASSFTEVTDPQAGDIVYWSLGHVAVVEDPKAGTFLGAQSAKSGLRRDSYTTGWWGSQGGRKFLRYTGA